MRTIRTYNCSNSFLFKFERHCFGIITFEKCIWNVIICISKRNNLGYDQYFSFHTTPTTKFWTYHGHGKVPAPCRQIFSKFNVQISIYLILTQNSL